MGFSKPLLLYTYFYSREGDASSLLISATGSLMYTCLHEYAETAGSTAIDDVNFEAVKNPDLSDMESIWASSDQNTVFDLEVDPHLLILWFFTSLPLTIIGLLMFQNGDFDSPVEEDLLKKRPLILSGRSPRKPTTTNGNWTEQKLTSGVRSTFNISTATRLGDPSSSSAAAARVASPGTEPSPRAFQYYEICKLQDEDPEGISAAGIRDIEAKYARAWIPMRKSASSVLINKSSFERWFGKSGLLSPETVLSFGDEMPRFSRHEGDLRPELTPELDVEDPFGWEILPSKKEVEFGQKAYVWKGKL
jgi:hypothetical protein